MKKALNHFTLFCLIFFAVNGSAYSANEYFRSIVSGDWNSTSTWQMSTNSGSTWIAATLTPTNASGLITVRYPNTVTITANVSADQVTIDSGSISVNSGIVLTILDGSGDDLTVMKGGTVTGSGTVQTQGTLLGILLRPGSNFNAMLKVNSGITVPYENAAPYTAKLYGPVTVDSGATLSPAQSSLTSYKLEIYGNLTNNGTLTSAGSSGKSISFKGAAMVNNGSVTSANFSFDSTSSLSGTGSFNPTNINIGSTGNVTMLSNMIFSPGSEFTLTSGAVLSPNGFTANLTSGGLVINSGATISNSGTFRTQNSVYLNLRGGSNFNAPLNVSSGLTSATDYSSPNTGRLYGPVTVDAGATLSATQSGLSAYILEFYGNLTNNGTLTATGASGKTMRFRGDAMINNGTVTTPVFSFDSASTLSGTGSITPSNILYIGATGNVSLQSNMTFSVTNEFHFISGGILNPNGFTANFTSGTLVLNSGATVVNSGLFRTQNNVGLNLRAGSSFNAPLNVNSGLTVATDYSSPNIGRLYGPVTVDNGATLSPSQSGLSAHKTEFYGNMTNNGILTGAGTSSKQMTFKGIVFINNGTVSTPIVNLDTNLTLSGTGSFITNANILANRSVTLTTNHQFSSIVINTGATLNTGSNTVKFTASNPITQNGTLSNTGSKIEYNGTALQSISTANIVYAGLRINNPAGASFLGNVTVNDTFSVIQGDVNLNGKTITLASTGYLTETPGNVLYGTTGIITYSRNIGIPTSLNAGGLGAVLTSASNLGLTEIKRGHTIQSGLNGGTSIKRYYDITPANNSGLNGTLVFKYDDSELNGKPETLLKLFKSTNSGSTWLYQIGNVNTAANEITLSGINSFSRWSSDSSAASASVKLIMEGFYDPSTNKLSMDDTVRAYLRNATFPFAIVDSAKEIVNLNTLKASFKFANAVNGTYYLQMKHRNSTETWSNFALSYNVSTTLNHDFTFAAGQAFGSNQIQVDNSPVSFAFYSGDANQDGAIDAGDLSEVENDISAGTEGYVPTDVNGDDIVDASDLSIVENNASAGIYAVTP
ncbi:MAG: hypothetical protein JNJ56_11985 [Ignavibacteria bacterium]|nr:hypothetical protein [Ignavibacteria bacterium]